MTEPAKTLDYGGIATRHDVICDRRDDGVTITLPETMKNYLSARGHPLILLAALIVWWGRRLRTLPEPPRMILELNRNEFRIDQRIGGSKKFISQSWPRNKIGELRPNRYGPGLYVRVPGEQNFDLLGDCRPALLKEIAAALEEAMQKTKPERDNIAG